MKNNTPILGYKVANPDGKCRGHLFEVGKEYRLDCEIRICATGFHFCLKAAHCFSYYLFDSSNVVFEVEAIGKVLTHEDDSKICTDHIRIIRQLTWDEVLKVANDGKNNTGHSNTGDSNTGYSNTGDSNTGYSNTGYSNTGDRNTGYSNTGDSNTGGRNTGDSNTGYSNTGDSNTGYSNTGDSNTGDSNTGDRNTGDRNTGDRNTGDRNTGYSNTGDRNTGAFCTGEPIFSIFNKPCKGYAAQDFLNSKAWKLICQSVDTKMWIYESSMTEEEKVKFPFYKTTGGYLKDIPYKEAFTNAWHNWSESNRAEFTSLPNFNAAIFEEITGVKVEVKKKGK